MMAKLKRRLAAQRAVADVARQFSGNLSADEQQDILNRRLKSAEYDYGLVSSQQILAELEGLADDSELLSLVQQYDAPKKEKVSALVPQRMRWAVAASVMLAVAVAGWFAFLSGEDPVTDIKRYVTRVGDQKTVTLTDGTKVTLNTATQLLVDINSQRRRIIMERGEAYYDVTQDPERPFTVELGDRSVTALGTQFNIRKLPDKFTLAVTEGVVSVHRQNEITSAAAPLFTASINRQTLPADRQHKAIAGMVVEYDSSVRKFAVYRPDDISHYQSWRSGLVRFVNEPLHKVVHELNRYSGKKIMIEDSAVMDLPVRATVRVNQADVALIGLKNSLPIKVTFHFDQIIIVGE